MSRRMSSKCCGPRSMISSSISAISSWMKSLSRSTKSWRSCSRTPTRAAATSKKATMEIQNVRRARSVPNTTLSFADGIAAAPHGLNDRLIEAAIQLAPEAVDVDLDNVRRSFPVRFPQVFAEHFTCDDLAVVAHQEFEQAEFGGGEVDVAVAAGDAAGGKIEVERADLQRRRGARTEAAADRLQPGFQLREGERLHQVIVRSGLQPGDALFHRTEGR